MAQLINMTDDLLVWTDLDFSPSGWPHEVAGDQDCDECGEVRPDVNLWAEDSETGEQVWLCLLCGCCC